MTLAVVCWLWQGGKWDDRSPYTADKANRWAQMVRANLSIPHEVVCVTDMPEGLSSEFRVVPLWDDAREHGGCYCRLKAFAPEMREVIGQRFAWLDLDSVVVGDLTPLLDRPEDIVFWRSGTTRTPYNGSMVMMTAGSRPQVWSTFSREAAQKVRDERRYPGTDQSWWSATLGPDEAVWQPRDGVYAYWNHCRQAKPENARVVFFPGSLKSNGSYVRDFSPWVREALDTALPLEERTYQWAQKKTRKPKEITLRQWRQMRRGQAGAGLTIRIETTMRRGEHAAE